jgi:dUTP pyrophosphatase
MFKYRLTDLDIFASIYTKGDRVGQMIIMPYPQIELVETDSLGDSERGSGGFGSTDPIEAIQEPETELTDDSDDS